MNASKAGFVRKETLKSEIGFEVSLKLISMHVMDISIAIVQHTRNFPNIWTTYLDKVPCLLKNVCANTNSNKQNDLGRIEATMMFRVCLVRPAPWILMKF